MQVTYEKLFVCLKNYVANWKPLFLSAVLKLQVAIQALQCNFPSANISWCNFHFNQSIWRNVQKVGLASEYTNNCEIRLVVRMCSALAHLPENDIDSGWLYIMSEAPVNEKITKFLDYYVAYWLENATISRQMWNCFGQRHRSNNSVEGWNHRLNSILKRPHPNLYEVAKCIKQEAEYSIMICFTKENSWTWKDSVENWIRLESRISNILKEFEITLNH